MLEMNKIIRLTLSEDEVRYLKTSNALLGKESDSHSKPVIGPEITNSFVGTFSNILEFARRPKVPSVTRRRNRRELLEGFALVSQIKFMMKRLRDLMFLDGVGGEPMIHISSNNIMFHMERLPAAGPELPTILGPFDQDLGEENVTIEWPNPSSAYILRNDTKRLLAAPHLVDGKGAVDLSVIRLKRHVYHDVLVSDVMEIEFT